METIKRPTKAHTICTILSLGGPMAKETILALTALLENKPYKPGSNGSYFQPFTDPNGHHRRVYGSHKGSLLATGLIRVAGKQGNTLLYSTTPAGESLAAKYMAWARANRA